MRLFPALVGTLMLLAASAARAEEAAPPAAAAPAGPSAGVSAGGPNHVYLVGDLLITEPRIEADAANPGTAMAYFIIENRGGAEDRLVQASSAAADSVVVDANGADAPGLGTGGLVIPPHQAVHLEKDGVHILFQGLHEPLGGQRFLPGLLVFQKAGPLPLDFATSTADAPAAPDDAADDTGASLTK